jgi:hypothetical protein
MLVNKSTCRTYPLETLRLTNEQSKSIFLTNGNNPPIPAVDCDN